MSSQPYDLAPDLRQLKQSRESKVARTHKIRGGGTKKSAVQSPLAGALQNARRALGFPYTAPLCPGLRDAFLYLFTTTLLLTLQLLAAIQLFGANLDDYLHLLLPPIVKLFDAPEVPLPSRK